MSLIRGFAVLLVLTCLAACEPRPDEPPRPHLTPETAAAPDGSKKAEPETESATSKGY